MNLIFLFKANKTVFDKGVERGDGGARGWGVMRGKWDESCETEKGIGNETHIRVLLLSNQKWPK